MWFIVLLWVLIIVLTTGTIVLAILEFEIGPMITGILAGILLIFVLIFMWEWHASGMKAKVFNRKYETSYTAEEFYWAEDTIQSVVEGKLNRLQLGGSLKIEGK